MLVSVLILCNREKYLNRTIRNLLDTAAGDIEILVYFDGSQQDVLSDRRVRWIYHPENRGRRIAINEAVKHLKGDYFFHIDGHCRMLVSGWDKALMKIAGQDGTASSAIWHYRGRKPELLHHNIIPPSFLGFGSNRDYREHSDRGVVCEGQEMMSLPGCAWMHHRSIWQDFNEDWAHWGFMGAEWALKNWLCGPLPKPIRLCSTVICEHIGKSHGLDHVNDRQETLMQLAKLYIAGKAPDQQRSLKWLIGRIGPKEWRSVKW
ncbi:MAG: glycosyltransferase family 2 protein [Phycisphaerae bacterium]|nr:glycosyltransferase family 2 protein [Phycisphaerae bacterium]